MKEVFSFVCRYFCFQRIVFLFVLFDRILVFLLFFYVFFKEYIFFLQFLVLNGSFCINFVCVLQSFKVFKRKVFKYFGESREFRNGMFTYIYLGK